jgi:hypothetical protein
MAPPTVTMKRPTDAPAAFDGFTRVKPVVGFQPEQTKDRSTPPAELSVLVEILAVQQAMLSELRAIRVALERRQPAASSPLSRADAALLGKLLPAIGASKLGSNGERFACRDLFDSDAPTAVSVVTKGLDAVRVGQLFGRAEGVATGGYVVQRDGDELNVNLWVIKRVVEGSTRIVPPRPSRDRAY